MEPRYCSFCQYTDVRKIWRSKKGEFHCLDCIKSNFHLEKSPEESRISFLEKNYNGASLIEDELIPIDVTEEL